MKHMDSNEKSHSSFVKGSLSKSNSEVKQPSRLTQHYHNSAQDSMNSAMQTRQTEEFDLPSAK